MGAVFYAVLKSLYSIYLKYIFIGRLIYIY